MKPANASGTRGGRPREFDREAALDKALQLFWTRGYEATSLSELTDAMGIAPPSLYAAFGNKQSLFLETVERYVARHGGFADRALAAESTARAAVERILREAAESYTTPGRPPGCFIFAGATNCSSASASVEEQLRRMRKYTEGQVRHRLARALVDGELPPETEVAALAGYVVTVMEGMSQQARDGASRAELGAIAEAAMRAWPRRSRRRRSPARVR